MSSKAAKWYGMNTRKKCPDCLITFKRCLENFYSNKGSRDGLQTRCKTCDKLKAAQQLRDNPLQAKRNHQKWYVEHKKTKCGIDITKVSRTKLKAMIKKHGLANYSEAIEMLLGSYEGDDA